MIKAIQDNTEHILKLCSKYSVSRLEIFGSAIDENRFSESESDLDFLVEFLPLEPSVHAKCYFSLLSELQELFSREIDLVESKAIKNPYLLEMIDKEREQIYAA